MAWENNELRTRKTKSERRGIATTRDPHKIEFLNKCRIREGIDARLLSLDAHGMNGAFLISCYEGKDVRQLSCIASDQEGWEHVSVTDQTTRRSQLVAPSWEMMCRVKRAFWDDEETVIEYHVPISEWINDHPGCLHLWRPIGIEIPRPPSLFVGIKI
jgi:hypothetical protein